MWAFSQFRFAPPYSFNVPLIVWGENSQNEYGGPAAAAEDKVLNRRWLEELVDCWACGYLISLVWRVLKQSI